MPAAGRATRRRPILLVLLLTLIGITIMHVFVTTTQYNAANSTKVLGSTPTPSLAQPSTSAAEDETAPRDSVTADNSDPNPEAEEERNMKKLLGFFGIKNRELQGSIESGGDDISSSPQKFLEVCGCSRGHLMQLDTMLRFTADALEESGITYWLDSGTLLGAYRFNAHQPFEDDVDLVVDFEEFFDKMAALRATLFQKFEEYKANPKYRRYLKHYRLKLLSIVDNPTLETYKVDIGQIYLMPALDGANITVDPEDVVPTRAPETQKPEKKQRKTNDQSKGPKRFKKLFGVDVAPYDPDASARENSNDRHDESRGGINRDAGNSTKENVTDKPTFGMPHVDLLPVRYLEDTQSFHLLAEYFRGFVPDGFPRHTVVWNPDDGFLAGLDMKADVGGDTKKLFWSKSYDKTGGVLGQLPILGTLYPTPVNVQSYASLWYGEANYMEDIVFSRMHTEGTDDHCKDNRLYVHANKESPFVVKPMMEFQKKTYGDLFDEVGCPLCRHVRAD